MNNSKWQNVALALLVGICVAIGLWLLTQPEPIDPRLYVEQVLQVTLPEDAEVYQYGAAIQGRESETQILVGLEGEGLDAVAAQVLSDGRWDEAADYQWYLEKSLVDGGHASAVFDPQAGRLRLIVRFGKPEPASGANEPEAVSPEGLITVP